MRNHAETHNHEPVHRRGRSRAPAANHSRAGHPDLQRTGAAAELREAATPAPTRTPCRLFVEQPTHTWFPGQVQNVITGWGGREGGCSSETSTVTVRLRQDRAWWPDRTLAQETSSSAFVSLEVRYLCDDDNEMKIFTETLTSSGQKIQSPRLYTYCG